MILKNKIKKWGNKKVEIDRHKWWNAILPFVLCTLFSILIISIIGKINGELINPSSIMGMFLYYLIMVLPIQLIPLAVIYFIYYYSIKLFIKSSDSNKKILSIMVLYGLAYIYFTQLFFQLLNNDHQYSSLFKLLTNVNLGYSLFVFVYVIQIDLFYLRNR